MSAYTNNGDMDMSMKGSDFTSEFYGLVRARRYREAWLLVFDNNSRTWGCQAFAGRHNVALKHLRGTPAAAALEMEVFVSWLA
ncbi:unnamed protein product [marine sediment metagenome]|uniref:Uncharacterized protein n=1 Tax=marine sediment metagenome TaxID=412755 RepID=X0UBP8_9ZZZZ